MTLQEVKTKYGLVITVTETNIHIDSSYTVHGKDKKAEIVTAILDTDEAKATTHNRSVKSYTNEWQAHNILYHWGIKRSHTADVDMDEGETALRLFLYSILALIPD